MLFRVRHNLMDMNEIELWHHLYPGPLVGTLMSRQFARREELPDLFSYVRGFVMGVAEAELEAALAFDSPLYRDAFGEAALDRRMM